MYYSTANLGENIGDPRYITIIKDNSKNIAVQVVSDTPEETDFIASSLKLI